MIGDLISNEVAFRLGVFGAVFMLLALWEIAMPRRAVGRGRRWPGNIGVSIVDALVVRLLFPAAAIGAALLAEARGWGVFQQVGLPGWIEVVLAFVMLDLVIYGQHVLFHAVPLLWRFHRMHHSDLALDFTTGLRFHPVEIVGSMLIKIAAVIALGAPVIAVLLFEVLLNAAAMFNHANVRIGKRADRLLRMVLVTPDMHRVHHSTVRREMNMNFGFCLPWWDHLFGTYRREPAALDAMEVGLTAFRDPRELRLDRMLMQPLRPD